jgi:uncharacterized tellurite resistance protein B-like protein
MRNRRSDSADRAPRQHGGQRLAIAARATTCACMLEKLMKALAGTEEAGEDPALAGRVAIAAVLVEAARSDDAYLGREQAMIERVLAERFGLAPPDAAALRARGEDAQAEAVDLVRFTRAIKDAVPHEDRVAVIEAVWRVIYADGELDHEESSLIRRLSGLLYVPDQDAGLARQRVSNEPREPNVG